MINFTYAKPFAVGTAVNASGHFIAGGTNLIDLMKRGVTEPEQLVDISFLPLTQIEENNGRLIIGSMVTNAALAAHALVKEHQPLLPMALLAGASPQIRNMATTGGNMMQRTRCTYFYDTAMPCNKRNPGSGCGALNGYNRMHAILGASSQCIAVHPSDMCVALAALDAEVTVRGKKGDRVIPFKDFHRLPGDTPQKDNNLQPGELILSIQIPPNNFRRQVHYLKIRDRSSYAFALVSVAAALEISDNTIRTARIALGGVAHKPWRATEAEKFLEGKIISENNFRQAGQIAVANAKGAGHNDFKIQLAPAAIFNALQSATKA